MTRHDLCDDMRDVLGLFVLLVAFGCWAAFVFTFVYVAVTFLLGLVGL